MISRKLEQQLREAAQQLPVIALLGPRQSGKTTLARSVFPGHFYVSLEDIDMQIKARTDPRSFLRDYPTEHGIIIDEVQHAPELLSYIQGIVDQRDVRGFFILTGSQNLMLNEKITQSLAGRIALLTLLPLSVQELKNAQLLPASIEDYVVNGSYPRVYSHGVPAQRLYKDYITTYIERDVRQIKNVGDLNLFQTFVQLCAGRTGEILNLDSLANDCGISHKTASSWLSILEATYIVFLVQPYAKNIGKRLIKAPKLYFFDTGIVCSLLGIRSAQEVVTYRSRGSLVETLVMADLFKQYYNLDFRPRIYFLRDSMHELDCLIEQASRLVPVEIKSGKTINADYFKQVTYWQKNEKLGLSHPYLVYAGDFDQNWPQARVIGWQTLGTLIDEIERVAPALG